MNLNTDRRQLTDAQRTMLGKKIEPDIAERAARRELAGKRPNPVDTCPQGTTRDEVAREVGIGSGRTYERHKGVVERAAGVFGEQEVEARIDQGATIT